MRSRVEAAVLENQEKMKQRSVASVARKQEPPPPSIKLKMDFSNFA